MPELEYGREKPTIEIHPNRLYLLTYAALLVLLSLTILFSFIDVGRGYNNAIAIGIACAKGLLIILFFMHVRYQPWVTWFFAAAGFLWLGIMLTLSTSEYLGRNHPPHTNPKGEPEFLSPRPDPGPLPLGSAPQPR